MAITDLRPDVRRRDYLPTVGWRLRRWWSRLPPQSRFFSRGTHYPSARARMVKWTVAEAIPAGLLGGLGYLLGHGTASLHWRQPWQGLVETATKPAVAPVLAFVILLWIAWWCRIARLAWLTWKPGNIVVPDFATGSHLGGATEAQLTSIFRNRLAQLRLQSAAPTPGAAASSDFVDVLDSSAVSSADVWKSLVALLRAAFPGDAIRITGTLRQRSGSKPYGVTVQASFLGGQTGAVLQRWDATWERVLEAAADAITSEILPRTRACRGPWAGWRGYQMPTDLLAAYEQAADHEQAGRYDSALDRYTAALELDPTNVELRLRVAQLEEKLGLFLEALTSYQSIHALRHPGAKNLPRGLYRRGARREWERAARIAKYRELVLLGEGSIIAQWYKTKNGEQLPDRTREELRKEFGARLKPLTTPRRDPTADAISKAIEVLLGEDKRLALAQDGERELAQTLRRWAYLGCEALWRSLPMIMLRAGDEPLTRTTVGLSMACIRQRYELLAGIMAERPPAVHAHDLPTVLEHEIGWARWPPGLWTRKWGPPRLRRRWHELYNAACLYAIPLNPGYENTEGLSEIRDDLARRAVAQLERASTCADSSFVATRRDWVLEQDHDLMGLRGETEFRAFASVYFPGWKPPEQLDGPRERLRESQYIHTLLTGLAEAWHQAWHARSERAWEVHEVERWYREELELWRVVAEVAHSAFDWRVRVRLHDHATELLIGQGREPLEVSFVGDANGARPGRAGGDGRPEAQLERDRERLRHLDEDLGPEYGPADRAGLGDWLRVLRSCDTDSLRGLSASRLRDLCHHQAAVWRALGEWMTADGSSSAPSRQAFGEELRQATACRARAQRAVAMAGAARRLSHRF